MATGPVVNQGKTAFLEEFLPGNRTADLDEANRAWNAAGNEGTLSDSLLGKIRSKLGLTAKKEAGRKASKGSSPAPKGTPPSKKPRAVSASKPEAASKEPDARENEKGPNKSAFVEGLLAREPGSNLRKVNEEWASAGHGDTISPSIYYKIKRQRGGPGGTEALGVSDGAPKSGPSPEDGKAVTTAPVANPTPKLAKPHKADIPVKAASSAPPPAVTHPAGTHGRELHRIEGEIDELVFRLKGLGDFAEVQEALRAARRLLIRSHED